MAREYAVRYTDESGYETLAYNPDIADPTNRDDADLRARCLRTWQEDRHIPQDATLLTRSAPDAQWEVDPDWQEMLDKWAAHCAARDAEQRTRPRYAVITDRPDSHAVYDVHNDHDVTVSQHQHVAQAIVDALNAGTLQLGDAPAAQTPAPAHTAAPARTGGDSDDN